VNKLEGKIALITGGNSALALRREAVCERGRLLFIMGRRDPELARAVTEIGSNVTAYKETCRAL